MVPDTATDPYGWEVSNAGLYDTAHECYMVQEKLPAVAPTYA